ncbi:MAG: Ger(x)C family spore germination protein [Clostridiaceae bacterium]|nr:Ger(x)C family spore germination protein [Clostridiaceae bacterium]
MMCRKIKKRTDRVLIACLLVFLLFLTGCWSRRDLTEISIVAGIGLDRTEDGKIILTVQVVEPAAVQSTASGKGGSAQQKPVFAESYEGETVYDAVRGILSVVDKKMFFGSAQVLIIGERLAQDGIEEVLDYFIRDHDFDYEIYILVAKDTTPMEIFEMETDIDAIPSVYIYGTVDNTESRGTVKKTMLIDLIKEMSGNEKQFAIGSITKAGEMRVKTEGVAVFRDGKLAGWMDRYETRGYLFAMDKIKNAIINVPAGNGKIAMEIMRSKGKISVEFNNGELSALIVNVKVYANVGEYKGKGRLETPDSLYELEKALGEEIRKEITMAVEKTQKEYCSDIFGFGSYVRKYHPRYWKKAKRDWLAIFSELPVIVNVDAKAERVGIVMSPIE